MPVNDSGDLVYIIQLLCHEQDLKQGQFLSGVQ